MVVKHQGFCGTWNNYTESDIQKLRDCQDIAFLACGRELAPTTSTPHLQFFFWTGVPRTPQQIKRKLPGAAIFVPGAKKGVDYHVNDDGETGFGYCFKEHQPGWILEGVPPSAKEFEAQAPKGKGARTDLLSVKKKIDEGISCESLMGSEDHFGTFAAHRKYFAEYQSYKRRRTSYKQPEVIAAGRHEGGHFRPEGAGSRPHVHASALTPTCSRPRVHAAERCSARLSTRPTRSCTRPSPS